MNRQFAAVALKAEEASLGGARGALNVCGLTKSSGPKLSFLVNLNPGERTTATPRSGQRNGKTGFWPTSQWLLAAQNKSLDGGKKRFLLLNASSKIFVFFSSK